MRGNQLFKKTVCALLAMTCLFASAIAQSPSPKADEQPATLDERLGADDGAALAILISANERGNLNLCDCNHPRGGLARRVGYLEAFKQKFKETPVLQVEAGFLWYNSYSSDRIALLQNDQVTEAYNRWPVDVINLGRFDLPYAHKLLAREGLAERAERWPVIKSLISANGVFDGSVVAPAPYIIKEVTGPRIKGRKNKLKVGFVGLAQPTRPGAGMMDGTVTNVSEAARRVVPVARKKCDVLVIVAHTEIEGAMQLARENPEADVVIAGNAEGLFKPRQVGNTMVVSAAPGNIQQGDLRVYLSKDGRATFKYISTDLDKAVPSDPKANAYVEAANRERENARFNQ
jgi:2',3'-cyclic-nucleotide 2'-phosphodiesterase (5'-nucleotidase family)